MEDKSEILLNSLLTFYRNPDHASSFEDLLSKTGGLSLRMLDWFVTDYAKEKKIIYKKKNGKQFFVHVGYKSGLKGYQKKFFDPFCRTQRIDVNIGKSVLKTTIAQLNFVKWCIQNQVIDYIVTNKTTLQEQMRTKNKIKDSNKNGRGTQEIGDNIKLAI